MTDQNDDAYDDIIREWQPASKVAITAAAAGQVEVRDSAGNLLADGDAGVLVRDPKIKDAGQTLKAGHNDQVDTPDRQSRRDRLPA